MNPFLGMIMGGLTSKAMGLLQIDKLVGMIVDKVANKESEDAIVEMAMTFVQPVVDQVESFIKATKTEIDDDLKPLLAMVFSVLSKIFGKIAVDLSDVNPE